MLSAKKKSQHKEKISAVLSLKVSKSLKAEKLCVNAVLKQKKNPPLENVKEKKLRDLMIFLCIY